ncbi:MAG: DsbA family protein [Candidatus Dasytiphilus stammeri]
MKKCLSILLICINFFSINISSAFAFSLRNGDPYLTILAPPLSGIPKVVEFFSFLCPHCYQLEYMIHDKLKNRYHWSFLGGSIGKTLTQAWSVAMVLEVQDAIIDPLFEGIKNKNIFSSEDVRRCFIKIGIKKRDYDAVWNSFLVQYWVVKQEEAAKNLKITSVPTIVVNGQYLITNNIPNWHQYEKIIKFLSHQTT